MLKPKTAALTLALTFALAACGGLRDSRLNPFNWFGRSHAAQATLDPAAAAETAKVDGRVPVEQVTSLEIVPNGTGAIVSAAGLPPTQGWWKAELLPLNDGLPVDGVMTYRFLVHEPPFAQRSSTPQSREVTAAAFLSNIKLQSVTKVVVEGASNNRTASR